MGNHYNCSECQNYYEACTCPKKQKRKSVGQELKEIADALEKHKNQEDSAIYWLGVRAQAQRLCEEAIRECRAANKDHKRTLGFGEIYDENVAKKLVECLEEEEFQVKLEYHEGTEFGYLHDDRISYWWVNISW